MSPSQKPDPPSYVELKDTVYTASTKPTTNFVYQGPIGDVDMFSDKLMIRPNQSDIQSIRPLNLRDADR